MLATAPSYPGIADDGELLADVACVALNRLPARYVRHDVDLMFYLTEGERHAIELAMEEALFETPLYRGFAGLSGSERIPDRVSILRFPHRSKSTSS